MMFCMIQSIDEPGTTQCLKVTKSVLLIQTTTSDTMLVSRIRSYLCMICSICLFQLQRYTCIYKHLTISYMQGNRYYINTMSLKINDIAYIM